MKLPDKLPKLTIPISQDLSLVFSFEIGDKDFDPTDPDNEEIDAWDNSPLSPHYAALKYTGKSKAVKELFTTINNHVDIYDVTRWEYETEINKFVTNFVKTHKS